MARAEGREETKRRLLEVVGEILADEGFQGLGVNKVAKRAGVDKVLIYRYFGGLPQLVLAFSQTVDFWPTVEELLGPDPQSLDALDANAQLAFFFKSYLRALRNRPITMSILAWRVTDNSELAKQIDDVRIRTALEFFERLEHVPYDQDLTAIVVLMFGAITNLILRSQYNNQVGGFDLSTDEGWRRIEDGIDLLLRGTF